MKNRAVHAFFVFLHPVLTLKKTLIEKYNGKRTERPYQTQ